jgi:splicing factor 3A subunit 3
MVEFTDEEGYGKYLDLHELYIMYINLKGVEVNFRFSPSIKDLDIQLTVFQKVDYISYLTTFDHLFDVPKEKKNMEYQKYLHKLLEYLDDYTQRVKPLLSLPNEMDSVAREFEQQWETGTFPGWPVSVL